MPYYKLMIIGYNGEIIQTKEYESSSMTVEQFQKERAVRHLIEDAKKANLGVSINRVNRDGNRDEGHQ